MSGIIESKLFGSLKSIVVMLRAWANKKYAKHVLEKYNPNNNEAEIEGSSLLRLSLESITIKHGGNVAVVRVSVDNRFCTGFQIKDARIELRVNNTQGYNGCNLGEVVIPSLTIKELVFDVPLYDKKKESQSLEIAVDSISFTLCLGGVSKQYTANRGSYTKWKKQV